jgi:hypothetical protein
VAGTTAGRSAGRLVPRHVAARTECAAARCLVGRIARTVRDRFLDACVRLVGFGGSGPGELHRPAATTVVGPVTGLVQGEASADTTPAVPIHLVGKGPVNAMAQAAEAAL